MGIPLRSYWELLAVYLRPQRPRVALLALLLAAGVALQLSSPQILRRFVDAAAAGAEVDALAGAAGLFLLIALGNQAVQVASAYVGGAVGWTATNRLRVDLLRHCLGLDLAFHKDRTPGELIERIDGDVTALATFLSHFALRLVANLGLVAGALVLLYREDWRVGLAMTGFAAIALVALNAVRDLAVPAWERERQASAELFGYLEERLGGTEDLRGIGAGPHALRRLHPRMGELRRRELRAVVTNVATGATAVGLFALGTALAFGLGAYLLALGATTLGTVFMLYQYAELLRRPMEGIVREIEELARASGSIARVRELRAARSTLDDGGCDLPPGPLGLDFDDVTFGYDAEPVLRDVSLSLAPGRVLGVVGRTGSGKTTLGRLAARLYDVGAGAVRVGGIDVREARLASLRERVGVVTQDVQLLDGTLRDNLALFDTELPDARLVAALGEVGLGEWYARLPDGLDAALRGGAESRGSTGLSAGEAQLLALARLLLRDPGLVLLDEASSRLDPATERLIERALYRLLSGRTAVVVAHRLSTLNRADEVLLLEEGRVVERGERAALVADPGSRFGALLRAGLAAEAVASPEGLPA